MTMRIRIRLFARQREIAGTRAMEIDLPDGASIEDAWAALVARVPDLASGRPYLRFARNGDYAEPTTALADGDEVVCIPPVSGGAPDDDGGTPGNGVDADDSADDGAEGGAEDTADDGSAGPAEIALPGGGFVALRAAPLAPETGTRLAAQLATSEDGAVVVFEGRTRVTPGTAAPGEEAEAARHAGRTVDALEYEAYEPLALRVLGQIVTEAGERFGVPRLGIVHAVGPVALGEVSIVVVACAPHRGPAFDAARYAIDETKARAPIWKAERFADGIVWIGALARTAPEAPEA